MYFYNIRKTIPKTEVWCADFCFEHGYGINIVFLSLILDYNNVL